METSQFRYDAYAQACGVSFRRLPRILSYVLAAAALAAMSTPATADLVVNEDLGALTSGDYPLAGTTVGGVNNADVYDITNPNLFWVEERVYQFSVSALSRISLTSDDPNGGFPGTDNDFFLTDSLATQLLGAKQQGTALSFVEVSGSLGSVNPGTYYLVVDAFRGGSLANPSGAGPYNAVLSIEEVVPPVATPVLPGGSLTGTLSAAEEVDWYSFTHPGGAFTVDTVGSTLSPDNDTELFLYDGLGALVAANDDASGLNLLSRISLANLAAGPYYLAIGGFNTVGDAGGWGVESFSGETGQYVINGLQPIPEPSTFVLAACGVVLGLGCHLRRRR